MKDNKETVRAMSLLGNRNENMNQRWFKAGLQLGVLAVLILLTNPWIEAVHLADCRHRHDVAGNHSFRSSADNESSHATGFVPPHQAEIVRSFNGIGHDPHHCSLCQSLRILATPLAFLAPPSLKLPIAVDFILYSSFHSAPLFSIRHSSQPRAPPTA